MDAIYFGFAKDCDAVPRERLLLKCSAHGIQGSALTWIRKKVTAASGECDSLKLDTGYKWDFTGQCIRATTISAVHQ